VPELPIWKILCQAPRALVQGRFDVDPKHTVYGFPARLIAIFLLGTIVVAIFGTTLCAAHPGRLSPEEFTGLLAAVLGQIILAAVLSAIFMEKRRPEDR
jgi:hypothetical protein